MEIVERWTRVDRGRVLTWLTTADVLVEEAEEGGEQPAHKRAKVAVEGLSVTCATMSPCGERMLLATAECVYQVWLDDGDLTLLAGRPNEPGEVDGAVADARFRNIQWLGVTRQGRVYVCEFSPSDNEWFRRYSVLDGDQVTTIDRDHDANPPACCGVWDEQLLLVTTEGLCLADVHDGVEEVYTHIKEWSVLNPDSCSCANLVLEREATDTPNRGQRVLTYLAMTESGKVGRLVLRVRNDKIRDAEDMPVGLDRLGARSYCRLPLQDPKHTLNCQNNDGVLFLCADPDNHSNELMHVTPKQRVEFGDALEVVCVWDTEQACGVSFGEECAALVLSLWPDGGDWTFRSKARKLMQDDQWPVWVVGELRDGMPCVVQYNVQRTPPTTPDSDALKRLQNRSASLQDGVAEGLVVFKVQDCTFHVLKHLLLVNSDYFRGMLNSGFSEAGEGMGTEEKPIEVLDASPDAFRLLVNWFYSLTVDTADHKVHTHMEVFVDALHLSDLYALDEVKEQLEIRLWQHVKDCSDEVLLQLFHSIHCNTEFLVDKCAFRLALRFAKLMKGEDTRAIIRKLSPSQSEHMHNTIARLVSVSNR